MRTKSLALKTLALVAAAIGAVVLLGSSCNLTNKAPSVPVISGPSAGVVGVPVVFKATATDPDGDSIAFQFDWGDTTTEVWSTFIASGETLSLAHTFTDTGTYLVMTRAKDAKGKGSSWCAAGTVQVTDIVRNYPDSIYAEIPVIAGYCDAAITPDGGYLYVAKRCDTPSVTPIRLADRAPLVPIPLEAQPYDIVSSVDGSHIYVALRDADKVVSIRTSDNAVDGEVTVFHRPTDLAVSPDGQHLVVSIHEPEPGRLAFVRLPDLSIADSVHVGASPFSVAIDRTGTYAYVTSIDAVRVMSMATHTVVDSISLDWSGELLLSRDGGSLYTCRQYAKEVVLLQVPEMAIAARTSIEDPGTRAQAATQDDQYLMCSEYNGVLYFDAHALALVDSLVIPAWNRGELIMHPTADTMYMVGYWKVYIIGPR